MDGRKLHYDNVFIGFAKVYLSQEFFCYENLRTWYEFFYELLLLLLILADFA